MLVHSVFFWLKPSLSAEDLTAFREGLESLRAIKTVEQVFIGTPAVMAKRPVVDDSYSFAFTVIFRDAAACGAYSVDPIHEAFVAKYSPVFARVLVYDAQ